MAFRGPSVAVYGPNSCIMPGRAASQPNSHASRCAPARLYTGRSPGCASAPRRLPQLVVDRRASRKRLSPGPFLLPRQYAFAAHGRDVGGATFAMAGRAGLESAREADLQRLRWGEAELACEALEDGLQRLGQRGSQGDAMRCFTSFSMTLCFR